MDTQKLRESAWIGDAVLSLWARRWILTQPEIKPERRAEVFISMTSNHFLSAFGEPTRVEARIGDIYEREGEDAACRWMDEMLLPVFKKQLTNLSKAKKGSKRF